MIGREAYHNPWWLAAWDAAFYGADGVGGTAWP
jgi:tRNA-dihydrouridine synthase A